MVASYNGWTASRSPAAIDIDPNFTAAGRKFPGGVKAGPVSVVLRYLVEQFDARVEEVDLYDPGDEWGYYYKPSANSPSLLSCHSSGTAIDINATKHPNGRRGTFTAAQVAAIRQILAELGGVVFWGGDFTGTPDEMHFEVRATAAEVAKVADRLASAPAPIEENDDMPSSPSIVRDAAGHRWVFARGSDWALWAKRDDEPWVEVGGHLTSGPTAYANANGTIEVVARGDDGGALVIAWSPVGGWGGWSPLGGVVA